MSKIAKYETSLENSKLLKEMHLPTGEKNNLKDPRNTLFSIHQRGKQKTLWYLSFVGLHGSSKCPYKH